MKYLVLAAALVLVACEDRFRYECQDPKNHFKAECNPPACEANGTCTKYLLGGKNED